MQFPGTWDATACGQRAIKSLEHRVGCLRAWPAWITPSAACSRTLRLSSVSSPALRRAAAGSGASCSSARRSRAHRPLAGQRWGCPARLGGKARPARESRGCAWLLPRGARLQPAPEARRPFWWPAAEAGHDVPPGTPCRRLRRLGRRLRKISCRSTVVAAVRDPAVLPAVFRSWAMTVVTGRPRCATRRDRSTCSRRDTPDGRVNRMISSKSPLHTASSMASIGSCRIDTEPSVGRWAASSMRGTVCARTRSPSVIF